MVNGVRREGSINLINVGYYFILCPNLLMSNFVIIFIQNVRLPHLDSISTLNHQSDGSVRFFIAVFGATASNYTLLAATSDVNIDMQSGVAVYRHVEQCMYR